MFSGISKSENLTSGNIVSRFGEFLKDLGYVAGATGQIVFVVRWPQKTGMWYCRRKGTSILQLVKEKNQFPSYTGNWISRKSVARRLNKVGVYA